MTRGKRSRDCARCGHTLGSHVRGIGECLASAVGCTCPAYIESGPITDGAIRVAPETYVLLHDVVRAAGRVANRTGDPELLEALAALKGKQGS